MNKKRLALLILCGVMTAGGWALTRTICANFEARYPVLTIGLILEAGGFILWMRIAQHLPRVRLILRAMAALAFMGLQVVIALRSWPTVINDVLPAWLGLGMGGSVILLALAFWPDRATTS